MTRISFFGTLLVVFVSFNSLKLIHASSTQDPSEKENFIVGGSNAYSGQFPYQVSLRYADGFHYCGGCIYSSRWILTAAHCVYGRSTDQIFVAVGTILTTSGTVYKTSRLLYHSGYDSKASTNDIGLIQTSTRIIFSSIVQPILLRRTYTNGGETAVISGWGNTYQGGGAPTNLQYLYVSTLTNSDCKYYLGDTEGAFVYDNVMCAYASREQGICNGDSGGPLVIDGELVGLASWVLGCAAGYPDAYVRVSYHIPWIIYNAV